jgi:TfdA family taurine catabolism dioxygenase TauD
MRVEELEIGAIATPSQADELLDCDPDRIRTILRRQGYVLFRGFNPSVDEFEGFAAKFGRCAGVEDVHYDPDGAGLAFHSEDAWNPYRPDAIWFLCLFEGSDGGVPTVVVDGVKVLEGLPPDWQSFCRVTSLRFDLCWDSDIWTAEAPPWTDVERALASLPDLQYRLLNDRSLCVGYSTPLVRRLPDGRESFANTLLQALEYQDFYGASLSDGSPIPVELTHVAADVAGKWEQSLDWQTGDFAVIDNRRVMHRRSPYRQKDRDLRVMQGEDVFGSALPQPSTAAGRWVKRLLTGNGPPSKASSHDMVAGRASSSHV